MKENNDLIILIIEDSPEDFETALRAFKKLGISNPVYHCIDGRDTFDFLYRRGKYTDPNEAPRPGIILLDLNLPGTDGREVLQEIKKDRKLKSIPVIVLSTSDDNRDVENTYEMGANCYIQKPIDFHSFIEKVKYFRDFWLKAALVPGIDDKKGNG